MCVPFKSFSLTLKTLCISGGQIRKVIMYDGVEAIEKIAIVFEQWKDALF